MDSIHVVEDVKSTSSSDVNSPDRPIDIYYQKLNHIISMVEKHCNLKLGNYNVYHIMSVAVKHNMTDVVELILLISTITSSSINMGLSIACYNGNIDIFNILLNDKRCDPSYYENNPLLRAIHGENLDIVKILLKDSRVIYHLKYKSGSNFDMIRDSSSEVLEMLKSACPSIIRSIKCLDR